MGFELAAVVAGPLAPERIVPVTHMLLERWPWLRLPNQPAHAQQVVLGSVERTSYMVEAPRHAQLLDEQIQRELAQVSAALPDCSLAWVHTDCFGGHGVDDGVVARAGARVCESASLSELLAHVGIETSGYFAAFERDHFGGNVDPRKFEHVLTPELRAELADLLEDEEPHEPHWLDERLTELHAEARFSALEQQVLAALDVDPRGVEPLHVLADAHALAGDPRGELLSLALAGKPKQKRMLELFGPLERQLSAIGGTRPSHLRREDWWPQVWAQWCGPWLVRLVIRNAVASKYRDDPIFCGWRDEYLAEVLVLLGQPCARYLGRKRVTLVKCARQDSLDRHDLSDFDLAGQDFHTAQLVGARFRRSVLTNWRAAQADLRFADFRDADLRNADLRQTQLCEADLRGADLRSADLRFADLRGARLDGGALASCRSEGILR